jgi:hypothetical protein
MITNVNGGFIVKADGKPTILAGNDNKFTLAKSNHPGVFAVFDRTRTARRAIRRTMESGSKSRFTIKRVAELLSK